MALLGINIYHIMNKQIICGFAVLSLLVLPTQSRAATPDLQTLTQQLQTLSATLNSLKMRGENASSSPRRTSTSTVDRTCMSTAVVTREDSIATAWTTFNTKVTTALTNRKNSLIAAWNISDTKARNTAVESAWRAWKSEKKSATDQLKRDRKAAWETFKTTAKSSCRVEVPKSEGLEKSSSDSISL